MKKIIIILMLISSSSFAEAPQIKDPWNVEGSALIKLRSMGFRWTQNLEGGVSKARLFGTARIKKYHKIKIGWGMGKLDDPTNLFDGNKRYDAVLTEYEYFFN